MVEGGATAIRRYKKLMLRRVKWTATASDQAEDDEKDVDALKESACG